MIPVIKQFINMFDKPAIQGQWKDPRSGDFFYYNGEIHIIHCHNITNEIHQMACCCREIDWEPNLPLKEANLVWLPKIKDIKHFNFFKQQKNIKDTSNIKTNFKLKPKIDI